MSDLDDLEILSLVAKITSEVQNHLGIPQKSVAKDAAEFLIDRRLQVNNLTEFKAKLASVKGSPCLPPSLIESVDRLVLAMHPKLKGQQKQQDDGYREEATREKNGTGNRLTGLAIADTDPLQADDEKDADVVDDTMALLMGLEGKERKTNNGNVTQRKRSRESEEDEYGRASRKRRDSHEDRHANGRPSRRMYDDDDDDHERSGRRQNGHANDGPRRNGDYEERRGRQRRRSNSFDGNRRHRQELDGEPILNKIYDGQVTGVKDFGAFVNLRGIKGKVDGLVHISALVEGQRVNHPSDLLNRGQEVKVKVIKLENNRIGLSMKEVDQETGEDLAPQAPLGSGANMEALGGNLRGDLLPMSVQQAPPPGQRRNHRKRMTSNERWEIQQLISSGAAKASDFPDLEADYNATLTGEGQLNLEEEVDIEIREEEPPFLAGQTKQSLELSPIRIVKAPDGSMNRAAMGGSALIKERKELKAQERDAKEQAQKVDLSSQWQDPMANPDSRRFAADQRAAAAAQAAQQDRPEPEWKRAMIPKEPMMGKRTSMSIKQQRESLPVFGYRERFLKEVADNQILVVVGETGSGKTTQLTQYLAEAGYANKGAIGCTQPRRVAAMSVSKRVAEEVGCKLGQEVGYSVRFDDKTDASTKIVYMTDGLLLRTAIMDPDLKRYSVIMLDEAHERTIATDVLFGLLKKTAARRPDLRIIVTSATLDMAKFAEFFHTGPPLVIPGRTFDVEVFFSNEPESDYFDAALQTVMSIHLEQPAGDILVFLTGQEEIDTAAETLAERMKALGPNVPDLVILPVYAALPPEMQSRIFEPAPPGARKVVLATNIAETSITIDGILFVVDPGFVKQNAYDPKLGMDSLVVVPISQASAKQRAGRAGRTGPGKCFRLYTESAFQAEMLPTTIPDIQRQNLQHTILMLKAFGINNLLGFDFMDAPPPTTMLSAMHELYDLSALDDEGLLTRLGRKMADFPMDPALAKTLLGAVELGCSDEVITIVAMLDVGVSIFHRPKDKQKQADDKKAKFHDPSGDHLTLLNVFNSWQRSGESKAWCMDNYIQLRSVRRAKDIRDQLVKLMTQHKQPIISCGRETERVRRALCGGYFRNSARKDPQEGYKTLIESTNVYMHPSSALFGKNAEWVIYHNLVLTTKEYMHMTTVIEPKWLVEAAPTYFKVADKDKLSKRQKTERIVPLHNKFAGEDDWRLSAQKKGGRTGGAGTWG